VGVRHRAPDRVASQPSDGVVAGQHGAVAAARGAESRARRARRRRAARGAQLPYAIVLAIAVAGLAWIWQGQQYVRGGTLTMAGALFIAALARLVLPERRVGMLASRRRFVDVTVLAVLATGLLVAGLVLPTPS
jgi:hypothetical protein